MRISRRTLLCEAAFASASALSVFGKDQPLSKATPVGARTGALGKVVGELPAGRYDAHVHVWGGEPRPEDFFNALGEAGLAGAAVFSRPVCKASRSHPEPLPPVEAIDEVIAWCSASPTLYPFYYIDPSNPAALDHATMAAEKGVYGFKIIHRTDYPCQQAFLPLFRRIAALGKPLSFHTGILWDGLASSEFFRPANWEGMLNVPKIRFATCHISWPWVDECIAVYGKLRNARVRNGPASTPEMFVDTTPGTPRIYRKDALTKLYTVGYDVLDHVFYGTDCLTKAYDVKKAKSIQAQDDAIFAELGLSARLIDSYYRTAFQCYLFG